MTMGFLHYRDADGALVEVGPGTPLPTSGAAGGGGGVSTVNGQEPDEGGDVTLDAAAVGAAPATHTHTAAQVSNATATGRSVLTAADAAAARTAIGAGTSSLAIGTTASTAAAGNHTHTPASIGAATAADLAALVARVEALENPPVE